MKSSKASQERPEAPEMVVTTALATTKVHSTPLPIAQLCILAVVMVNESLSDAMLLPFLAKLVAHLRGISEEEAGYSSGFLISAFMAGQFLTCKWWGAFSDKYGRKKPLVVGLAASGVIVFLFGLSTNMVLSVILRFIHGFFNANVLIAKTVIADITDKTNEARGFIVVNLTWAAGSLTGPFIGGYLYVPSGATSVLGIPVDPNGFFSHYPAFLPCLIVCLYATAATIVCCAFLEESKKNFLPFFYAIPRPLRNILVRFLPASVTGVEAMDVTVTDGSGASPVTPVTKLPPKLPRPSFGYKQAFTTMLTRYALVLYMLLAGSDSAYTSTFSLYTSASRRLGGLGMTEKMTGNALLINSIPSVTANLVFPKLCRVIKKKMAFWRLANFIMMFATFFIPVCALVDSYSTSIILLIFFGMIRQFGSSWSYSMIVMLTARSTTRENVGAMYGISQAAAAIVRSVVPLIASPMFAWSINGSNVFPFNHFLVYIVFSVPLIVSIFMSRNINFDSVEVEPHNVTVEDGGTPSASTQFNNAQLSNRDESETDIKDLLTTNNSFARPGDEMAALLGMGMMSINASFVGGEERSSNLPTPHNANRSPNVPLYPVPTSVEDRRVLADGEELIVVESEDVPNNKQ